MSKKLNHIVDLKYLSEQGNQEAVLDVLFEHACELGINCLVTAIENYWENKANGLTNEGCLKMIKSEKSARVYFYHTSKKAYIQSVEIAPNDPSYIKIHTHGDYCIEDKQAFLKALEIAYETVFKENDND